MISLRFSMITRLLALSPSGLLGRFLADMRRQRLGFHMMLFMLSNSQHEISASPRSVLHLYHCVRWPPSPHLLRYVINF
jgi:hypothetical protein